MLMFYFNFLFYFIIGLFSSTIGAQVAITEVYYDTPDLESDEFDAFHRGEFIELYNYTTEDIDISRWVLSDAEGNYTFPEHTVIDSGGFLIIAFRKNGDEDWNFFDYFRHSRGQNDQNVPRVLYQDRLELNNYDDRVALYATHYKGIDKTFSSYKISEVSWLVKSSRTLERYYHNGLEFNPEHDNFYVHSLSITDPDLLDHSQPISDVNSNYVTASPFEIPFKVNLKNPAESPFYLKYKKEYYEQYYQLLGDDENIEWILNQLCNTTIPLINTQTTADSYTSEQCFSFDKAGNQKTAENCIKKDTPNQTSKEEEQEDIKDIASKIEVYPVPVQDFLNIRWTQEVDDLVDHILLSDMLGCVSLPIAKPANSFQTRINVSSYADGVYIVSFFLKDGRRLNKNILKY